MIIFAKGNLVIPYNSGDRVSRPTLTSYEAKDINSLLTTRSDALKYQGMVNNVDIFIPEEYYTKTLSVATKLPLSLNAYIYYYTIKEWNPKLNGFNINIGCILSKETKYDWSKIINYKNISQLINGAYNRKLTELMGKGLSFESATTKAREFIDNKSTDQLLDYAIVDKGEDIMSSLAYRVNKID